MWCEGASTWHSYKSATLTHSKQKNSTDGSFTKKKKIIKKEKKPRFYKNVLAGEGANLYAQT